MMETERGMFSAVLQLNLSSSHLLSGSKHQHRWVTAPKILLERVRFYPGMNMESTVSGSEKNGDFG